MKKVIVNGSTSFIGVHLIEELIKNNYEVIGIIRENSIKKELLKKLDIKIIELNIENIDLLLKYNISCGTFYDFVWNGTRGSYRNDRLLQEENLKNAIKSLKVAKVLGTKTFFSSGSQAEYGNQKGIIREDAKCNPNTEYGKNKLKFYLFAKEYCQSNNIRFVEPRYFSLYGPLDYKNTLIMSSLNKMLNNETLNLTSCTQIWNYLYIKDAVKLLVKLNESSLEGIFNIGSNDTRALKEYIEEMKNITGHLGKINYGAINQPETINNIRPDISRVLENTDWYPQTSFDNGINEILSLIKK